VIKKEEGRKSRGGYFPFAEVSEIFCSRRGGGDDGLIGFLFSIPLTLPSSLL
jgi:hypothetical protein